MTRFPVATAAIFGAPAAADAARIAPLSAEARAAMTGKSWHDGCPVGLDDLAAVTVSYVDFEGTDRTGAILVHRQLAPEVADTFDALLSAKFPMTTVAPWEEYGSRAYADKNVTTGF